MCADLESVVNPIVKKKYRAGDAYVHDMFWLRTDDCVRLWGHLKILEERNLWPLTTAVKNRSIATVCDILSKYEHYELRNQNCGACPVCAIDFDKEVHSAAIHAMNSFEGLCLHCIKLGSNKDGEDNKCDFHTEKAVPDPGAR